MGAGVNFIVEDNVINGNGRIGGAAINLAGVRDSLFQNNLVYGNHAAGIAEWDNGNPYDAAAVSPGPQTAVEVTGPDVLPLFGCTGNIVRNNTVLSAVRGRAALIVGNGSWGTRAVRQRARQRRGRVDRAPQHEHLEFEASRNVLGRVSYEGPAAQMKGLAMSLPDGADSVTGVTKKSLAPDFAKPNDEPWVLLEGNWWRLNPARPDFHPRAGSARLAGRGDASHEPPADIDGRGRARPDIGAYAAQAAP